MNSIKFNHGILWIGKFRSKGVTWNLNWYVFGRTHNAFPMYVEFSFKLQADTYSTCLKTELESHSFLEIRTVLVLHLIVTIRHTWEEDSDTQPNTGFLLSMNWITALEPLGAVSTSTLSFLHSKGSCATGFYSLDIMIRNTSR